MNPQVGVDAAVAAIQRAFTAVCLEAMILRFAVLIIWGNGIKSAQQRTESRSPLNRPSPSLEKARCPGGMSFNP